MKKNYIVVFTAIIALALIGVAAGISSTHGTPWWMILIFASCTAICAYAIRWEMDNYEEEISHSDAHNRVLQNTIDWQDASLQGEQHVRDELRKDLHTKGKLNQELRRQLEAGSAQIDALIKNRTSLELKLKVMRGANSHKADLNDALNIQLEDMDRHIKSLVNERKAGVQVIGMLRDKLQASQQATDETTEALDMMAAALADARNANLQQKAQ